MAESGRVSRRHLRHNGLHACGSRMVDYYIPDDSRYVQLYAGMPIFVCGTIGNALSLIVLCRRRLRRIPTSIFLMVLAVVDTLCLCMIVFHEFYFGLTNIYLRNSGLAACRILRFLLVAGQWSSAWIIVAVSFQRALAVSVPLKARTVNTVKSSAFGAVGILIIAMSFASHFFWTYGRTETVRNNTTIVVECAKIDKHFVYQIWPWIDLTGSALAPFFLLIILNVIIIVQIHKRKLFHRGQNSISRGSSSSNMTAMVLTLSISFLVLTLPSHVYFIARPLWYFSDNQKSVDMDQILYTSVSMIKGLNHGSSIIFYCVSGKLFRAELKALFCGRICKPFHANGGHGTSPGFSSCHSLAPIVTEHTVNKADSRAQVSMISKRLFEIHGKSNMPVDSDVTGVVLTSYKQQTSSC